MTIFPGRPIIPHCDDASSITGADTLLKAIDWSAVPQSGTS